MIAPAPVITYRVLPIAPVPCGRAYGTYQPGKCAAHWCPTFALVDPVRTLGKCNLIEGGAK